MNTSTLFKRSAQACEELLYRANELTGLLKLPVKRKSKALKATATDK